MKNTIFSNLHWLFFLLFCAVLHSSCALAESPIKSVFISGIINEQTHAISKEIIEEAYRRLDYDIRFGFFPGQRSIIMANTGESDGDIGRIKGTENTFTNLVMVPTPIIQIRGVVFTKSTKKQIHDWKDLKGLRIGIIRGIRYSEIGTQGFTPFYAEDMTHLFRLLDNGMIQVAIAVLKAGQLEIARNFKDSDIHQIGEPLYMDHLYHYINRKNIHIIPELNKVLQDMTAKGEIQKAIDHFPEKYFQ